jgi:hypothetical protein
MLKKKIILTVTRGGGEFGSGLSLPWLCFGPGPPGPLHDKSVSQLATVEYVYPPTTRVHTPCHDVCARILLYYNWFPSEPDSCAPVDRLDHLHDDL